MKKSLILASLLISNMAVTSTVSAATPSFDSVSVEYQKVKESSEEAWSFQGSKVLTDILFVNGEFTKSDHVDLFKAGLGVHYDVMDKITAFFSADLVHADVEFGTEADIGHGVSAGLKGMVMDNVELSWTSSYSDVYDSYSWSNKLEAHYYVSDAWSLGAGFTFVEDTQDLYSAKVSWHF